MADYLVSYNANGGVGTIADETATSGSPYTFNDGSGFTYEGFNLIRWDTAANGTGTDYFLEQTLADYNIGSNLTVYAYWVEIAYNITYNNVTGATHTNQAQYTVTTPTITLTDAVKTGYTFGGWFSDETLETEVETITLGSTGDLVLYAKFTAIESTATFDYDEATSENTTVSVSATFGSAYGTLPAPLKTGYTFQGWYTAETEGTLVTAETIVSAVGNHTLYAIWEINSVTITFNSNGGTSVAPITDDYGETVTEPTAPTKTGYTFADWYTDAELTSAYTFTTMPATSFTLYAKWTANTYTVSYNANTGTGTIANGTATYGSNFTVSDGTGFTNPAGYGAISHWNTAADNSGTRYDLSKIITPYALTANLTLYAIWTPVFFWNDDGEIEGITSYGKTLSEIVIPSSIDDVDIEIIRDASFADCDNLTTLTIGANIKSIGGYSFVNCSNLETVTFANGSVCEYIGDYAFAATQIAEVAIPATVTKIDKYAFSNCYSLTTVEFAAESALVEIGMSCFLNDLQLATIVLPEGLKIIGSTAFCSCKSLTSIIIPESVEKIYYNCFKGCFNLTAINVVADTVNHNWKPDWHGLRPVVYGYTAE